MRLSDRRLLGRALAGVPTIPELIQDSLLLLLPGQVFAFLLDRRVVPSLLLFLALVAIVGWTRVELHDHTIAQVIAGAGQGAVVAAAVFHWLR